jgi:hypothetical protein
MADLVTNKAKFELFTGDANLDAADLRVALVKTTAPTPDTNFMNEITELTVGGYARQTLTGETVTEDDTNDFAYLDFNDPDYGVLAVGETIIGQVLFRHTGSDATAPVYCFYDLTDTPTFGGNFSVTMNSPANGAALKGA